MVHGSGFRNRGESVNFATRLADSSVAVFRYDKRGVVDSGGAYEGVSTGNSNEILNLLAVDSVNAIHFLQNMPEIDPQKIGLYGNSQAGWIMPISAASSSDVAFAVLLVGPAISVGIENRYSSLTRENASNTTVDNLDVISLGTHSLANAESGEFFDFMSDIVLDWIHNIVD